MELIYTVRNGVMYPDLVLPDQSNHPIGKYGKMRLDYLKKHRCGGSCAKLKLFGTTGTAGGFRCTKKRTRNFCNSSSFSY